MELAQDQYGNYVVQHVVEFGEARHKEAVMKALKGRVADLSCQKFSSNVIERCLKHVSDKDLEQLLLEIIGKEGDRYLLLLTFRHPPLYAMMKDKFGNYVMQKAVEVAPPTLKTVLVAKINVIPDPNLYCTRAPDM